MVISRLVACGLVLLSSPPLATHASFLLRRHGITGALAHHLGGFNAALWVARQPRRPSIPQSCPHSHLPPHPCVHILPPPPSHPLLLLGFSPLSCSLHPISFISHPLPAPSLTRSVLSMECRMLARTSFRFPSSPCGRLMRAAWVLAFDLLPFEACGCVQAFWGTGGLSEAHVVFCGGGASPWALRRRIRRARVFTSSPPAPAPYFHTFVAARPCTRPAWFLPLVLVSYSCFFPFRSSYPFAPTPLPLVHLSLPAPSLPSSWPHALVLCVPLPTPLRLFALQRLFAESPHIGELYVRYVTLEIGDRITPLLTADVVLPRLLSRLPRLTHVSLEFPSTYGDWPLLFKAGMQATLSLHCLRSPCLYFMDFPNTSELELLLSHATGLKALTLGNIYFGNPSVRGVDPLGVHIFLESLELELEMEAVDAIVSGFSIVDINHLKSLVTKFSLIIPLLKPPDPDILKGNQTLHIIEIIEYSYKMASALQQFGHLCHLKVLKTISLDFADRVKYVSSNTEDWTKLDAILSQAVDGLRIFTYILSIR
ncbi:hypothetical protein C8J57DRAFT_1635717 [Mycena rebaudengoi]|nr:hypothetical protein C8J57DRAFT_1635717 [Mycena rebaudengoi]